MHGYGKLEWANGDTYHGAFAEVRNVPRFLELFINAFLGSYGRRRNEILRRWEEITREI
jgi:hypothetical protein